MQDTKLDNKVFDVLVGTLLVTERVAEELVETLLDTEGLIITVEEEKENAKS